MRELLAGLNSGFGIDTYANNNIAIIPNTEAARFGVTKDKIGIEPKKFGI
jgi:hypothetical protein